ncbi:unnamed protein product [Rotaria sp. Silwood1]|nr:unnamed protein product [Rotaria sp. Silwood1]CAF1677118.1 unnamed protein product [Rotaria sp. Silwood1]
MPQQPLNQGFFQFQHNGPYIWQQQQQGQFMSQGFPAFSLFPPFPNFVPFPNNVNYNTYSMNYSSPNPNHMFTDNDNNYSSAQYQWQSHHPDRGGNNKTSYERNGNQEQYASYPEGAVYRRASGPGWQRQEMFYPSNSFK